MVADSCSHPVPVGEFLMELAVPDGACHCGYAEKVHRGDLGQLHGLQRRGHSVAHVKMSVWI